MTDGRSACRPCRRLSPGLGVESTRRVCRPRKPRDSPLFPLVTASRGWGHRQSRVSVYNERRRLRTAACAAAMEVRRTTHRHASCQHGVVQPRHGGARDRAAPRPHGFRRTMISLVDPTGGLRHPSRRSDDGEAVRRAHPVPGLCRDLERTEAGQGSPAEQGPSASPSCPTTPRRRPPPRRRTRTHLAKGKRMQASYQWEVDAH